MSAAVDALALPCTKAPSDVVVLVNHDLCSLYRGMLDARFPGVRRVYVENYLDLEGALDCERPDVVLSFRIHGGGPYPHDVMLGAPSVRWIHAGSAGVDHLAPWDPDRLMVTNSAGIQARPMAEFALWAVLTHTLRMPTYASQQRHHVWRPHPTLLAGDFTALVVGFGRIGEMVGVALKRLGMHVTGVRTRPGAHDHAADRIVGASDLATAVGDADFVLLTLPRTAASIGLFDAAMLARMKPGATLINLSRGGIVDEAALCRALSEGTIAGAILDVVDSEPLCPESPLWDAPNLIITPHVSADIRGWHVLAAEVFADNLERWLSGRPVANLCDPRRGY